MVPSSLFILASSVYTSLQCLISTLTQGGKGGHLFGLTCSVVLWEGRDTVNKWHVWGVLTVYGPHWVCPGQSGMCLLGPHFSGSRVLCKGTVQSGPCVLCTSQILATRVLGYFANVQTCLGMRFVPFPGASISGE